MSEYHPRRVKAAAWIAAGVLSIAGGVAAVWDSGSVLALAVLGVPGVLFLVAAWGILKTQVLVDDEGLEKRPGCRIPWQDVESWFVRPRWSHESLPTRRTAIRIRGRWLPLVVYDWEVEDPGFDDFVADLQARAGPAEAFSKGTTPRALADPAWRRVAAGLWLKFLALAALAGAAGVALTAALSWKVNGDVLWNFLRWSVDGQAVLDVLPLIAGLLAVAIALDVAGWVLCLTGPREVHGQRAVLGSVLVQGVALLLLLMGLAWSDTAGQVKILAAAVLSQLSAAVLFVDYLTETALTLGRGDLLGPLLIAGRIAGGILGFGLLLVFLWALAYVPGLSLVVYCVWLIPAAMLDVLFPCGFGRLATPALFVVLVVLYFCYGRALVGLAREIGRRRREPGTKESSSKDFGGRLS